MSRNRSPRPALRSVRSARALRLFRPAAPFVALFDGDRDTQRQQSDLRAARSRQLPEG